MATQPSKNTKDLVTSFQTLIGFNQPQDENTKDELLAFRP